MASKRGPRYTVEAGRQIYRDGEPFISIGREGHTDPSNADDVTYFVMAWLNKTRWPGDKYPNDYMRSGNSRRSSRRSRR